MKAAVYGRYGSPDTVTADDPPKPVPRDDEVVVRIHALTRATHELSQDRREAG